MIGSPNSINRLEKYYYYLDKAHRPDSLEFDISVGISRPKISHGILFQFSYGILTELMQTVFKMGTKVFLYKNNHLQNGINEFLELSSCLTKKKIDSEEVKKIIGDIPIEIKKDERWYLKNFSNQELFRKNVEAENKSASANKENITYIYAHDLIQNDILDVFHDIYKHKSKNICIKMKTISSSVSYDFLKIVYYIFEDVFIFKSPKDSKIKDSWYIMAKIPNIVRLEEVVNKIKVDNKKVNLMQILKVEYDPSYLKTIYSNLSYFIQYNITNEILNVLT
jgi:hypothetical protein